MSINACLPPGNHVLTLMVRLVLTHHLTQQYRLMKGTDWRISTMEVSSVNIPWTTELK